MNLINEITDLVNQLDSVVDDSKSEFGTSGIYEVCVSPRGSQVNLCWMDFLQGFEGYDVDHRTNFTQPYTLTIEHEGIEFITRITDSEMQIVQRDYPDDYTYIFVCIFVAVPL